MTSGRVDGKFARFVHFLFLPKWGEKNSKPIRTSPCFLSRHDMSVTCAAGRRYVRLSSAFPLEFPVNSRISSIASACCVVCFMFDRPHPWPFSSGRKTAFVRSFYIICTSKFRQDGDCSCQQARSISQPPTIRWKSRP